MTLVASLRQKLKEMRRPKKLSAKNQMSESDSDVDEGIGQTGTLNLIKEIKMQQRIHVKLNLELNQN